MPDKTPTSVRRRRIAGERARANTPTRPPRPRPARSRDRPAKRPSPPSSEWRPDRRTYAWFVPLCAIALIAVALAGWFGYQEHRGSQIEDARSDAVAPAGQAAEALLSYRHDTLDAELNSERGLMTDSYAERFLNVFPEQALRLTKAHGATVESTVLAAAPLECGDDCSSDRVEVLLYLDTESTVRGQQPETSANRAIVTMEREDDTWRVGGIEVF